MHGERFERLRFSRRVRIDHPDCCVDTTIECGVADSNIAVVAPRVKVLARREACLKRCQDVNGLLGKRNNVRLSSLHTVGLNRPGRALPVDLLPSCIDEFTFSHHGQQHEL